MLYFPLLSARVLYGKKHSYKVNLFLVSVLQCIPEGDNCIFAYQHYTMRPAMNVHVHVLSSMATIIYVFVEFNFSF